MLLNQRSDFLRSGITQTTIASPDAWFTSSGNSVHVLYSPVVNEDGSLSLKESGKESILDMIQSHKNETDMSYIIARLNAGDTSVLGDPSVAMYGDFTDLPTSRAAMMQQFIDAQLVFDRLPLETRANFGNDFRAWFVQAGSPDWITKMGGHLPDVVLNAASADGPGLSADSNVQPVVANGSDVK